MRILKPVIIAGALALSCVPALAQAESSPVTGTPDMPQAEAQAVQETETTATSVAGLPEEGEVTLTGTVEKIKSKEEFTLRDESGTVEISLQPETAAVFKEGDTVTVTGEVESGLLGSKTVNATEVEVHQDLSSRITDTITETTGVTIEQAENVNINSLPDEGMVKISGTVDRVDNNEQFTLNDGTGKVDVVMESEQRASLDEGTPVTVVGYVKDGLFSKDISATQVILSSDSSALRPLQ